MTALGSSLRTKLARASYRLRKSRLAFRLNQWRLRLEASHRLPAGVPRAARERSGRMIALSYDDGPSPANTPELLEIFAAAGARATFFVVGSEVARHPALAARIGRAGHELGNHSHSHANPRDLDDEGLRLEMELGTRAIAQAAAPPTLFRPPFGKRPRASARVCAPLGLTSVLWSLDSGDTMPFTASRIAGEVVGRVQPGDIVLMHDGGERRQRTIDATRQIVTELSARGYRFVTVSELLSAETRSGKRPGKRVPWI
jgi:peptidoglycan/xylan/chitin deacetylase (PgdA/CDA1 family)